MTLRQAVPTAMVFAYPLISHFGVVFSHPALPAMWLGAIVLGSYVLNRHSHGWLAFAFVVLLAVTLAIAYGHADALLRVPPILIAAGLALLFGRTLLPGRQPLISAIGERLRGELPPSVARYGRRLTWVWAVFFIVMGIESLLLALFASPYWWSLFTNFLNYLFVVVLFVAEYPIRRIVLHDLEHGSLMESIRGSLGVRLT